MTEPRKTRVLLICGSLRQGSTNQAVLETAAALAPPQVEARMFDGLAALPHFNPDDDFEPLPESVRELRAALSQSDCVLFCTPEYAGALPGSFKNLLDWTIGGGEIYAKPVAWINAAGVAAPTGGADAHDSLRKVLTYAGADIVDAACRRVPVPRDAVSDDGVIRDSSLTGAIADSLAALSNHAGQR
jgi:chromate reductase, NAD(P)H dehydrogenase (quinone)